MKYIPAVLLFLAVSISTAEYYPVRFEDGVTYSATETSLYAAPCDTAEVITVIPPGELLEIQGFTGEILAADSCSWGWYEAQYRVNNELYSGFVIDRDLAFASLTLGIDTLFVFRLTGFDVEDNAFDGEVSVIAGGEKIFTQSYRPHWTPYHRIYDYEVTAAPADSRGIEGVSSLIILYFSMDYPGVECREDILAWTTGHKLVTGPQTVIPGSSDTERYTTEMILPATPGGHDGQIQLNLIREQCADSTHSWEAAEDTTTLYRWTGEQFTTVGEE